MEEQSTPEKATRSDTAKAPPRDEGGVVFFKEWRHRAMWALWLCQCREFFEAMILSATIEKPVTILELTEGIHIEAG